MKRLDLTLLARGLASTRTKAQALIREGKVKVGGRPSTRPGELVAEDAAIELTAAEHPYVSRGGLKLEAALEKFSLSVRGLRALDVGQSTGGFTDCLLRAGAAEVTGVEVGQAQLAPSLRADPRVRSFEKQDIRTLEPQRAGAPFDFCVVDLSFISLALVVPALPPFLAPGAAVVLLVKPQFEVGPALVGSGGIVRSEEARAGALQKVEELCALNGFELRGRADSPVAGGDGNREFLLSLRWRSNPAAF